MTNQNNNRNDINNDSNKSDTKNKIIALNHHTNSNHWWKVCWFYDQQQQHQHQHGSIINSLKQNRKYFTLPNRRLLRQSTTSQMQNINKKW